MMSSRREYLEKELKHIKYYNSMAPFPVFDTEYVEAVEQQLKDMDKKEYDKLPVKACNKCGSLHIVTDEMDLNNVCIKCGTVNDLVEYKDIHKYLDSKHGKFWNS